MHCSEPPMQAKRAPEFVTERTSTYAIDPAVVQRLRFIITLLLVLGAAGGYILTTTVRAQVNRAATRLAQHDVTTLRAAILLFGSWVPAISTLVLALPDGVRVFANGLVFGIPEGRVLTAGSALLAATLSFWLSRAHGRSPIEILAGTTGLRATDAWLARHGAWVVLLTWMGYSLLLGWAVQRVSLLPFWNVTAVKEHGNDTT